MLEREPSKKTGITEGVSNGERTRKGVCQKFRENGWEKERKTESCVWKEGKAKIGKPS